MIDPASLDPEKDVYRLVRYIPLEGRAYSETGIITSWNSEFIFVRYGQNPAGTATSPANLEWATPIQDLNEIDALLDEE